MPSAWLIGSFVIKSSIVVLIASFIVGLIFFRFTSLYTKLETKQRIDEVVSLLIAFVASLWIGKILINFSTFLSDPRAILAYPSDSKAFYIAVFFTIIYAKYRLIRNFHHFLDNLLSFMIVFLSSSLVYEFIYIIWGGSVHTWGYLGLLVILLTLVTVLQGSIPAYKLASITLFGWSLGQLILSIFSSTAVFQFNLNSSFYIIIFICSILLIIYRKRLKI
ncbi:hypothetical protein [Bacillus sp. JJ722]|uniref:hypothetical protein n=1 Tax=Bacillus sp. JJ722 TaxID=3122973 RepID=UPI002FFF583A